MWFRAWDNHWRRTEVDKHYLTNAFICVFGKKPFRFCQTHPYLRFSLVCVSGQTNLFAFLNKFAFLDKRPYLPFWTNALVCVFFSTIHFAQCTAQHQRPNARIIDYDGSVHALECKVENTFHPWYPKVARSTEQFSRKI